MPILKIVCTKELWGAILVKTIENNTPNVFENNNLCVASTNSSLVGGQCLPFSGIGGVNSYGIVDGYSGKPRTF